MPGGDPRFGGGAEPPVVRHRGKARWVAFWGLVTMAAGAGWGFHGIWERYQPEAIRWDEVGLFSLRPAALGMVAVGVVMILLAPLLALSDRRR
jgi:hypothetical protein